MSRARVAVLQVVAGQITVTEAAVRHGISRRHLQRLLARYRDGGLDALEPGSRRPKSNPGATSTEIRERVIELRGRLTADGLDAGPVTIGWHLEQEGLGVPAPSTISRILVQAGLITPEPRKRPRSSYLRFEADQPNETWQSDFIYWQLADGTDVEILNWLDDHSRYLLSATVHQPVTGDVVLSTFLSVVNEHGVPASTLTDNGRVYTARSGGGRNAFEYALALLGVRQKNGAARHPQTQGKVERFHQTEQRWLNARPVAATIADLQSLLDIFREHYNERRPHRARGRDTPGNAYRALPKALPSGTQAPEHYRLRYDRLDTKGKMSIRRAGRMHHLGVGAAHARKRVLAIADDRQITVTDLLTGEVLSSHDINPEKTYWRNTQRKPGRWPDSL